MLIVAGDSSRNRLFFSLSLLASVRPKSSKVKSVGKESCARAGSFALEALADAIAFALGLKDVHEGDEFMAKIAAQRVHIHAKPGLASMVLGGDPRHDRHDIAGLAARKRISPRFDLAVRFLPAQQAKEVALRILRSWGNHRRHQKAVRR
jgi:hypothetical protein